MAAGLSLIGTGLAIGVAGVYVGEMDDAPGAALAGILMMIVLIVLGFRKLYIRKPGPD